MANKFLLRSFFGACIFFPLPFSGFGQMDTTRDYKLICNINYTAGDTLKADFYLPVNYVQQKNPVLVFAAFGDFRSWEHYIHWGRLAASEGFCRYYIYSKREYSCT